MTYHEAIGAIQAHLGHEYLAVDVDLDPSGRDWLGCIEPTDSEGETVGTITMAEHGRCAPMVWWD